MLTQFILENSRFAINLFAALIFFAIFWLYFDAWKENKLAKELTRFLGFLLVAISFLGSATIVESTILQVPSGFKEISGLIEISSQGARVLGYFLIVIGLRLDPMPEIPKTEGLTEESLLAPEEKSKSGLVSFGGALMVSVFLYPILAALVGFMYFRRATEGLERHLRPIAYGFFVLALSEAASIGFLLRNSDNIDIYNFVVPYGPLWLLRYALLVISIIILGKWVFTYLLKRIVTQLFMIFTSVILIIFLITTVTFTWLLLNNLERETLDRLSTDVRVLDYAIDTRKSQAESNAQLVAQSEEVLTNFNDPAKLSKTLENFLLSKGASFVWVVDANGVVLSRGENNEHFGDSISEDPLFKKTILGESASTLSSIDGPLAPSVFIRAGSPIKTGGNIVGVVIAGEIIDNAFVDGIKSATALEASVYGGNQLSATTLLAADGANRPLGLKEENEVVKSKVLGDAATYTGAVQIFNIPYFGGYLPLRDIENKAMGMLFVGKPQIGVLQLASFSIQMTFIATVALLILSIIPAHFVAKAISNQIN